MADDIVCKLTNQYELEYFICTIYIPIYNIYVLNGIRSIRLFYILNNWKSVICNIASLIRKDHHSLCINWSWYNKNIERERFCPTSQYYLIYYLLSWVIIPLDFMIKCVRIANFMFVSKAILWVFVTILDLGNPFCERNIDDHYFYFNYCRSLLYSM